MKFCRKHWQEIRDWNDDKSLLALVITMQLQFEYFDIEKFGGDIYKVQEEIESKGGCIYCILPEEKSKLLMQRVFREALNPSKDMIRK